MYNKEAMNKQMKLVKEGNIKQVRNENTLRKREEKTQVKEGQELLKGLKKNKHSEKPKKKLK